MATICGVSGGRYATERPSQMQFSNTFKCKDGGIKARLKTRQSFANEAAPAPHSRWPIFDLKLAVRRAGLTRNPLVDPIGEISHQSHQIFRTYLWNAMQNIRIKSYRLLDSIDVYTACMYTDVYGKNVIGLHYMRISN